MKRFYTTAILLLISSSLFSQKLDYDNDSRWFWGLNAGAAWNTTDVKNKTKSGWGFTIGKAFNYNYGKKLSFDLRMRYLGGRWAGQDYDTTSLLNYNSSFSTPGNVVNYYDTLGYTINNFQTRVHELGLELVLHANGLREKTGWDPYIFGGANIVFNQTKGNLLFEDTLFGGEYLYNYSPSGMSKTEWNNATDDDFETALDGSSQNRFNVDFMPSLGVGLAYQVAPRFSVGVEHKTTFAMNDLFDGYEDPTKRWGYFENDIYHYTSAFMKFHLRRRHANTSVSTDIPDNNSNTSGIAGGTPCPKPKVKFIRPNRNITVYTSLYEISAKVEDVAGRNNITYSFNGSTSTNFLYNGNNESFQSEIVLTPGNNIIEIKAGNACGNDSETVTINYVDCIAPSIRFIAPKENGTSVKQSSFILNANISNTADVALFINGISSTNFTFNESTGSLVSRSSLVDGKNTFRIVAKNDCGTVEETIEVTFSDCVTPFIMVNTVSQIVDKASFTFSANINSVTNKNNIGLRLNGMNKSFSFNPTSHLLTATLNLRRGTNTFELFASNDCGTDTETVTIEYVPCSLPTISILEPTNLSTESGSIMFKAKVTNVSGFNNLTLVVNGNTIAGGTYNASTNVFEKSIILQNGDNSIELIAKNDCGIARKSIVVTKEFEEEKITICHYPPGNTENPQEIQIALSAWPAHQAHGDKLGPCPEIEEEIEEEVEEEKITICHYPPGNNNNPQEIQIALSAWPAHQAHGDKLGPCPEIEEEVEEEKITICHYPPGNNKNPQEIQIALSAWPAHQAHGDKLGPCPEVNIEERIKICHYTAGNPDNPEEIEINLSDWPTHQAHGDKLGPCPIPEQVGNKITICHQPVGSNEEPVQMEVTAAQWLVHKSHGDKLGPCPETEEEVEEVEEKVVICHKDRKTGKRSTMTINRSDLKYHLNHGDELGQCKAEQSDNSLEEKLYTICHTDKRTGLRKTIKVNKEELKLHLRHGDKLGKCPADKRNVIIPTEEKEPEESERSKEKQPGKKR